MSKYFDPEFRKEIVRLRVEENRTLKSLAEEYGAEEHQILAWILQYRRNEEMGS